MDDCENESFVNIHGKDIRILKCDETGAVLIPIDELKDMGFSIYHKSQYNKLLIDEHQFNEEFYLYMLQCAQTYMLKNQEAFQENEILKSINNCKKILTQGCKEPVQQTSSSQFLQHHVIEQNGNEHINVTSKFKAPATNTERSVHLSNKQTSSRQSYFSSESSSRSNKFNFEKSGTFNDRKPRASFEKKNQNFSFSYEQRKPKKYYQNSTTSPVHNKSFSGLDTEKENYSKRVSLNYTREKNGFYEETRKLRSIFLDKPEHNVLITHLEGPTVAWVQDIDNANMVVEIAEKVEKEVKTACVVSKCEFNTVYLAMYDGEWYRCKIIKSKPLTVTFLDFGNCMQVTESDLREVSTELAEIPAHAVKVIFEAPLSEQLVVYKSFKIKVIQRGEKGTYIGRMLKEDPENQ